MRAHSAERLPADSTLLRNWKRWEAGTSEPDGFHKTLIARTFGTVAAAFFPPPASRAAGTDVIAATGMETVEILARLRSSDVSDAKLQALQITYAMDCYRLAGEDRLAEMDAGQVIRSSTDPDGAERKPMRIAEAQLTLGVVSARTGDLDRAVTYGRRTLHGERKSLPSLLMCAKELATLLRDRYPKEPAATSYLEEVRALSAGV